MVNNNASSGNVSGKSNSSASMNSVGASVDEKTVPKDARAMISILKDMGISDFEPRVVNQLLEFSYRYVSTILEDSKVRQFFCKMNPEYEILSPVTCHLMN